MHAVRAQQHCAQATSDLATLPWMWTAKLLLLLNVSTDQQGLCPINPSSTKSHLASWVYVTLLGPGADHAAKVSCCSNGGLDVHRHQVLWLALSLPDEAIDHDLRVGLLEAAEPALQLPTDGVVLGLCGLTARDLLLREGAVQHIKRSLSVAP